METRQGLRQVADPLGHDRITFRLGRFILDAGMFARAGAPRWTVPTLLLRVGADQCVSSRGSAAFAATAPRGVASAREWPGLAHAIFNEPEREQALDALQGRIATQ